MTGLRQLRWSARSARQGLGRHVQLDGQNGGYLRACHPTADHAPRSARAARRPIKPRQVDRKDGCQGLPLGALEQQDATDLNAARSGCPHARL